MNDLERLQMKIIGIDRQELLITICKNIKKFRLERYVEYKQQNPNKSLNPFTTENIAALLNYNHNHYKRFESDTDSTINIGIDKLVKLSIILNKSLDDFIK